MRLRSHKYPDDNKYIDTTHYDEEEEYLDLGYQRLKIFHIRNYPELGSIKKLFIDHNNLTSLPDPSVVPNLTDLTCASNQLASIPFYPKLTFLNISDNQITDLDNYHNSKLEYLDCSNNLKIKPIFKLPNCEQLFITDMELESIDLNLFPDLRILDCGNNKLSSIISGEKLEEINIQYNQFKEIPVFPNLLHLHAESNLIQEVPSFPKLLNLNISFNQVVRIHDQPSLKKLIANNNKIEHLGSMPNLKLAELEHNLLTKFHTPSKAEYISIQFNPLSQFILEKNTIPFLKEIQINFATYRYIYSKHYDDFKEVSVATNHEKLSEFFKKIEGIFSSDITEYIANRFSRIEFGDRQDELLKISIQVYLKHFKNRKEKLDELLNNKEFKMLLENITKLYYKTIVFTLYFNEF